ncbi:hypothetical protein BC830DRAFT_335372 [Chytriomyces sp. MP71]|nr:hypothetical protein BC830DRAFT_335372 [Chytriomyces sp. MP71]
MTGCTCKATLATALLVPRSLPLPRLHGPDLAASGPSANGKHATRASLLACIAAVDTSHGTCDYITEKRSSNVMCAKCPSFGTTI